MDTSVEIKDHQIEPEQSDPKTSPSPSPKKIEVENTMHDKCKNVIAFHNNLKKFFVSLKGVLPEYVDQIRESIKYYKSLPRSTYLQEVQELLEPHIKYVSEYDDGIFTDDYMEGPRLLLPKMDFREIWALLDGDDFTDDPVLQAKTKKTIFNHIQSIYVSVQMAMDQIDVFNKNIEKQKTFLMDMLENLQLDDKIKARIEEMKKEEEDEASKNGSGGAFGLGKLTEMFGEDNFVYQLAKDVAEELDIGTDEISNPVEAITALFADNGKKLQELIVTVGDKIEQKVQSGEIDKDKLVADARSMKDKLEGFMGKIPGLENMVNNNQMLAQFKDFYQELAEDEQEHFKFVPELVDKNIMEWTDQEKQDFDEYAKYVMEKNGLRQDGEEEEDMNIDTEKKPKSATKKSKAKKSKAKIRKKNSSTVNNA
jgi:hypothetical protein